MDSANVKNFIDKLLGIPELSPNAICVMDEVQLKGYIQMLIVTADTFPFQKMELETVMESKEYPQVLQWLKLICSSLAQIHADYLVRICDEQINLYQGLKNIRHERLKVFVDYFLATLTIFFDDIYNLFGDLGAKANAGKGAGAEAAEDGDEIEYEEVPVEFEVVKPGKYENSDCILAIYKMRIFSHSLKAALVDTEHKLVGVTSGEAALAYLKEEYPDLLIIDENLPGIGAYDLTRAIRKLGQESPIIYTTSTINRSEMVKFMEAGVADFIMKPINASDAQKKVEKYLR